MVCAASRFGSSGIGVYFVVVLVGLAAYATAAGLNLRATLRQHWKSGVAFEVRLPPLTEAQ